MGRKVRGHGTRSILAGAGCIQHPPLLILYHFFSSYLRVILATWEEGKQIGKADSRAALNLASLAEGT